MYMQYFHDCLVLTFSQIQFPRFCTSFNCSFEKVTLTKQSVTKESTCWWLFTVFWSRRFVNDTYASSLFSECGAIWKCLDVSENMKEEQKFNKKYSLPFKMLIFSLLWKLKYRPSLFSRYYFLCISKRMCEYESAFLKIFYLLTFKCYDTYSYKWYITFQSQVRKEKRKRTYYLYWIDK